MSFLKLRFLLFILILIINILLSNGAIDIGEFTLIELKELYEDKGGKYYPPDITSPTNEYYQLCVFNNQIGEKPWDITPEVNITEECYNKILKKNSGAEEILIYKFFRIRNTTELEPGNLKNGISKVFEVYYQFFYFKNGGIEESNRIDIESMCNENILVYYRPTVSSDLETKFLNVAKQSPYSTDDLNNIKKYDIFNPNSDFYSSICTPYTYNTFLESFILKQTALRYYDLSLEKRKLYFPGTLELCLVSCDYLGTMVKSDNLEVVCLCDDQHFNLLEGDIPQSQSFTSVYYDEDKFNSKNKDNYFSIDVIACIKIAFMQAFNNNYGSYITLGMGVIIILSYGDLFLWGKWRILYIFELIFNNNINSINYMKKKDENSYNKLYENRNELPQVKDNNIIMSPKFNQNDFTMSMSSKRGLIQGSQFIHNNLLDNHKNSFDIQNNRGESQQIGSQSEKDKNQNNNEEDEGNEELEGEEKEDESNASPPKKKIIKKKQKQSFDSNSNEIQNYEISAIPNEMSPYEMSSNVESPSPSENYQNDEQYYENYNIPQNRNNKHKKSYNKRQMMEENNEEQVQGKRRKSQLSKNKKIIENSEKQKKKKKSKKNERNETNESFDDTNYIPDITKSQIVIPIDNIFTDQELDTMSLDAISQYDHRTFFDFYFSILNTKAPIFFIFSYYNSIKGISLPLQIKYPAIKLIFFCIIIYICFFFNATVFGTKSMTYILEARYSFGKHIAFAAILAPFCLIIKSVIHFLIFNQVTQKIIKIKTICFTSQLMNKGDETTNGFKSMLDMNGDNDIQKDNNINFEGDDDFNDAERTNKEIKEERIKLRNLIMELLNFIKKRVIISIVCLVIIILFIWYYIAAFCVCYRNSQVNFLLNVLITFIFCNIIPCFYCFLPAYLRRQAINKHNKNILLFYKICKII